MTTPGSGEPAKPDPADLVDDVNLDPIDLPLPDLGLSPELKEYFDRHWRPTPLPGDLFKVGRPGITLDEPLNVVRLPNIAALPWPLFEGAQVDMAPAKRWVAGLDSYPVVSPGRQGFSSLDAPPVPGAGDRGTRRDRDDENAVPPLEI